MSIVDNYGFRFMILGTRNNMYSVRDLLDNSVEWFPYRDIISMSKKVKIMGVVDNFINLNWLKDYYAMCIMGGMSQNSFKEKFGLILREGNTFAHYVVSDEHINFMFSEFLDDLCTVTHFKNSGKEILKGIVHGNVIDRILSNTDCSRISELDKIGFIPQKYWGRFDFRVFTNKHLELDFSASRINIDGSEIVCNSGQRVDLLIDCEVQCNLFGISDDKNIHYTLSTHELYIPKSTKIRGCRLHIIESSPVICLDDFTYIDEVCNILANAGLYGSELHFKTRDNKKHEHRLVIYS